MLRLNQFFQPFFDSLDPASAFDGDYHAGLVGLSLFIASLSAFVALSVSDRLIAATTTRGRLLWAGAGAVSMGGGIWAMHFIGMLAFSLPCRIGYDPIETVLSMIPGVLASGAALSVIGRSSAPTLGRLLGGALLMGGGIGAMHYSGMAAMRPEALLVYDVTIVGVSVLVAATLSLLALSTHFYLRSGRSSVRNPATLLAAAIMGLAVACMHYTAMYAASFYPLASASLSGLELDPTLLAMLIALFAVLITSMTFAATYAGRQIDLVSQLSMEIAHRSAIERDAQRGRARTQAIVDSVADAIVTIDRSGRIRQWSLGAERIFGYTSDEVIGTDLTILMPEPHRSRHDNYVNAFLTTRDAKIIGIGRELTALRKDGSEFPIDLTVTEVKGIDEVLFTGILRDITDRKRAEQEVIQARQQAEAASQAKSEFIATMSHEIRTPMNGVLGLASLLASTELNDRQTRLTDNLMRSGQALMGIINDILDFSKIEAGRLELLDVEFEPREVIAEIADLFSERCASKGLEFIYFVDESVPDSLRGDPIRLRQICTNLVSNAIKFTERGEILVQMSVSASNDDNVELSVAVVDSGIGIPPEQLSAVFESFHQVDSSMTRSRGGSGLGLAIVRQLVTLMGGEVGVDSELGGGSRFWFTAQLLRTGAPAALSRSERHLSRSLSALLVDANAVSAQVTSQYLSAWGIEAEICRTPAEAMLAAASEDRPPFDVAIIDIKGLGAGGMEIASAIRSAATSVRKAPEIILLAGLDSVVSRAGDLEVFASLSKPFRPSELFDCLVSIAAGTRQRRRLPALSQHLARSKGVRFNARVLVAEDNAINQDVAVGMLELLGCRAVTVPNGLAAIRAFTQDNFDLILMDCEMPEMDGFQAAQLIRDTERLMNVLPENQGRPKHIPIIAITAHALAEIREKCFQVGMDDFVTKPFNETQLADALRRHLTPVAVSQPSASDARAVAAPATEVTPNESAPPIDFTMLDQIRTMERRGSKGLLRSVVGKFVETAPGFAAEIRARCNARDVEAIWKAAHSLKSSAGAVGAIQVSMRCSEIEAAARGNGSDAAAALLDAFDAEMAIAIKSLRNILEEADAPVL